MRTVAAGETLLADAVTRRLIERFVRRPQPGEQPTRGADARESEVLELIARGLSNAEIAERSSSARVTEKTHVTHVLQKLGLRDRVQAVIFAYESGVVEPGG